jgi:UDP-N-acetyl-D-galactosamine dehydrogenase
MNSKRMKKIAVIGQGYVGLPLALEFAKHTAVIGFDIDTKRVQELNKGVDFTKEVDLSLLKEVLTSYNSSSGESKGYKATNDINDLKEASIYIVTVPTPIDAFNRPDLQPLRSATIMLGQVLKKDDIVIYESTVYPGCTEEVCVPLLEQYSHMVFNQDFFVGYSPERINPGDKVNTLTTIKKVTSGSTTAVAEEVDQLYKVIVTAGTHQAPSIKVAEAAKAIENAQRDVNISFVNELALIFDRVGIDTQDVLAAAGTKFNFLKFSPGLVGGHCISVDPYYLVHKAKELGYHPAVILSGRSVNDSVAGFIASKVVKLMINKELAIKGAKVLILGLTFKENCPDTRNTKVIDLYRELVDYGLQVDVCDPWADADRVKQEYNIKLLSRVSPASRYDAVVLTVAHDEFKVMDITSLLCDKAVVFDCKSVLPRELVDGRL